MLTLLHVENFVFIENLTLSFSNGMTVLTGETGAGKSAVCNALWVVLNASSDKSIIQEGHASCRVRAIFDIKHSSVVKSWLEENDYVAQDQSSTCCIERVIPEKGHAKSWINGKAAKAADVKWLGSNLVTRHSQHAYQNLLSQDYQRNCLDRYGNYPALLRAFKNVYTKYTELTRQKKHFINYIDHQKDKISLLQYQLEELDTLQIQPNEVNVLERRQKELAHATQVLEEAQQAIFMLSDAEPTPLTRALQKVKQHVQKAASLDQRFEKAQRMLEQMYLELVEADKLLRNQMEAVVVDPEALYQVDKRLEVLYQVADKHRTSIEHLPTLVTGLRKEQKSYENNQAALSACERAITDCREEYQSIADQLSQSRVQAAQKLEHLLTQKIQSLGMPGGKVVITLDKANQQSVHPTGHERVSFLLSAALGQPLQELRTGISGGELSRLSLALQVLTAHTHPAPTFIFDEVDVGVGGGVAERMGILLQELSRTHQVLCITHAPQIAVLGNNHYLVEKQTRGNVTRTNIVVLKTTEQKIPEIARMLGGIHITEKTIAYAQSMLKSESL